MTSPDGQPTLASDFGLIPIAERLVWRDALSRHILDQMDLSEWKKQEHLEPMNLTIACLIGAGMTDPQMISQHILHNEK